MGNFAPLSSRNPAPMLPEVSNGAVLEVFPSGRRTAPFLVACLLLVAVFLTVAVAYGPSDRVFLPFLGAAAFFAAGSVYLVRRVRKPLLRLNQNGLTYFPFDDPITWLRFRGRAFVPWLDIREIQFRRVRGMLFLSVIGARAGQRPLVIPLSLIPMATSELLREVEARAPHVRMPA